MINKNKIAIVATVPLIIRFFLIHHIIELAKCYDVTLITNLSDGSELLDVLPDNVKIENLLISRDINIFADLCALISLVRILFRSGFSLVYSISPKAGLLAMLAAKLVFVPHRLHTFTGQVWATKKGLKKYLLSRIDKLISKLSTIILIDSYAQADFLKENNILGSKNALVLGDGSVNGVDIERFHPDELVKSNVRKKYDIDSSSVVFLYLGRLKKDKGLMDLTEAYRALCNEHIDIHLLIVGPDEDGLSPLIYDYLQEVADKFHLIPYTRNPESFMMASDILLIPSYREGFGTVVIEAAACGVLSIGTNIYGLVDAIVDGETGLLTEVGNVHKLKKAMSTLACNRGIREKMARSAKERAISKFSQKRLTDAFLGVIHKCLAN